MKYQLAHYSLRGARPRNEDRVGCAERDNAVLLAVADGLGGHRGGEIAAEILVQTLVRNFQGLRQAVIDRPSAFLALGILQAHHAIIRHAQTSATPIEPRTTCVVCLVQNGYAYWAHVGDSRLYLIRQDRVLLRTQDHTAIDEMHQGGLLTEQEVRQHPHKSHLLNCLGGGVTPTISVSEETLLLPGDTLLACTDGLWEAFDPEEIASYLRRPALDEAVEEMLYDAVRKRRHSCDNVSAACLRWEDGVSRHAPLQGNAAGQVDEEQLRQHARHHRPPVTQRPQTAPVTASTTPDERDKPIKARIQELEDFLKKFEAKG